ncbi:MAG: lamin tail domain-containing protein [Candidatus Thorarchaeota archaeon]
MGFQWSVSTVATISQVALVINEVEQNPPGIDAGNEWVELYNPTPASVVLTGWTLSTRHGRTVTIRLSGSIDPCGCRVIRVLETVAGQ